MNTTTITPTMRGHASDFVHVLKARGMNGSAHLLTRALIAESHPSGYPEGLVEAANQVVACFSLEARAAGVWHDGNLMEALDLLELWIPAR